MAKNILDDEVLKANQRFIKNNIKEQTLIEATEENNKAEFGILYDKENNKAIEDPKRNIEIGIDTAKNRTPSPLPANPTTEEFTVEGFEVTREGKWRKLVSPNTATIDDEIDSGFENREGLDYSKEITREDLTSERNNIIIAKLQDDEGNLIDPSEAIEGEEYTPVLIDRRDKQEITRENIASVRNNIVVAKLQDSEGNLIDPDDAIEGEEYTQVLVARRDKQEITREDIASVRNNIVVAKLQDSEGNLIDPDDAIEGEEYTPVLVARRDKQEITKTSDNKEFKLKGFEKQESGKWKKLSATYDEAEDEIDGSFENRESLDYKQELTKNIASVRNSISIVKLQDSEGNLIDPDEAIEEEEYTLVLVARRDKQEITKTGENRDFPFLRGYVVNPDNTLFPNIEKNNNFKITQDLISDFDARAISGYIVKLQDSEGNLIDPDDAIEEEEYTQVLVRRRDRQEIVSSDERLNEFEYDQRYENDFWNGNLLGEGRAKEPGDIGRRTIDASGLEQRNVGGNTLGMDDARMRELSIFLLMLFPYIGTSTIQNIRSAVASPDIVGLATSASQSAYYLLQNLRYYTPFELAKYFLHNFYTLHFLKEMTIKYPPGRAPSGAPDAKMWDGVLSETTSKSSRLIQKATRRFRRFRRWISVFNSI